MCEGCGGVWGLCGVCVWGGASVGGVRGCVGGCRLWREQGRCSARDFYRQVAGTWGSLTTLSIFMNLKNFLLKS